MNGAEGRIAGLDAQRVLRLCWVLEALFSGRAGTAGSTPIGRLAQTDDLAHAVSFLASDGAAFLTGLSIPVTGGSFMR